MPAIKHRFARVQDRINAISKDLDISEERAFMRYVYAVLFDKNYYEDEFEDNVTDGGSDKQIDIVEIEREEGQCSIHLVQVKNTDKFKGTVVVQMRDALEWIFVRHASEYRAIPNKALVAKIDEIRATRLEIGTSNMFVYLHYVANGDASTISPDFSKEVDIALRENASEFGDFQFKIWGVVELIDQEDLLEQTRRRIDVKLPVMYDVNKPSLIRYGTENVRAVVCTVQGTDLANLVAGHRDWIFDENVRMFLGYRRRVNRDIVDTAQDPKESGYFWFFNNGITVTCDSFDLIDDPDNACIRLTGMQIVNGRQTSEALVHALAGGKLQDDVRVLVKVFATADQDFVDRITLTTNNQNAVTSRDLASNHALQRDIQRVVYDRFGYHYETKPRQFAKLPKAERSKVVPNEKVGQAHIAAVLKLPAVAMSQKSSLWSEYYKRVFTSPIEQLLAAYKIYEYCARRKHPAQGEDLDKLDEAIKRYGVFHLTRIIGETNVGNRWYDLSFLSTFVQQLELHSGVLDRSYELAFDMLKESLREHRVEERPSLFNAFKSTEIHQWINDALERTG